MSLRLLLSIVAACAAICGYVPDSLARPRLAILGLDWEDEGDAGSQEATANLAKEMTTRLRERAALSGTAYQLIPGQPRKLAEMKLLHGCFDESASCMSTIGKELGADHIVYGRVSRRSAGAGAGFSIALSRLDLRSRESARHEMVLRDGPTAAAIAEQLEATAVELLKKVAGIEGKGSIMVRTNVGLGIVSINGEPHSAI
ncbi:MAG: hypothetical protein V2A73_21115, partial [Pseudomonadota bacterium]